MNLNIKYPPLVEEGYRILKRIDPSITKQEAYKALIKYNMIDEEGNPTEFAIKNGLVAKGKEEK